MLSKKQKIIYEYIVSFVNENGFSPSLEEIAQKFSSFLKYPSSAFYHVKKLQEEGLLEKSDNKSRSIYLTKKPFPSYSPIRSPLKNDIIVPILGSANAGVPTLFAEENVEGYLKINYPRHKAQNIFALRVKGSSMNMSQINGKNMQEGDYAIIDPQQTSPNNNDYVLSIIDNCANLKKFHKSNDGTIMLLSESSEKKHKPIFVSSHDQFMVNGKIIDVIKK